MKTTFESPVQCGRHTPCASPVRKACGLQLLAVFCLLTLSGCWSDEPFEYVKVHGKVSYEDGSLISAGRLDLHFFRQGNAPEGKHWPRPGVAYVDIASGEFDSVTSHMVGDGLVPGKYKVVLGPAPLSPSVAPPEYGNMNKTPLEIDTANSPFELKVRKPR